MINPIVDGEVHDRAPQTLSTPPIQNRLSPPQLAPLRAGATQPWRYYAVDQPRGHNAWTPPQTGKRGAEPLYSDLAIETALTLRLLFHLPLRQTEGFLGSVLRLMGLELPCPDHTTLVRRNATVAIRRRVDRVANGPESVIVDSAGLKVSGQGEQRAHKHGEKKRRRWKKLNLSVDDAGHILAS